MKRVLLTTSAAIGVAVLALATVGGAIAQGQPGSPGYGMGGGMGGGHYMMRNMSPEDMAARHAEMFKVLDVNDDGTVSQEEFTNRADNKALQELREKRREERRADHFAVLDTNKDGTISTEEWQAAPQNARGPGGMGQGMGPGSGMMPGQGRGPQQQ